MTTKIDLVKENTYHIFTDELSPYIHFQCKVFHEEQSKTVCFQAVKLFCYAFSMQESFGYLPGEPEKSSHI